MQDRKVRGLFSFRENSFFNMLFQTQAPIPLGTSKLILGEGILKIRNSKKELHALCALNKIIYNLNYTVKVCGLRKN